MTITVLGWVATAVFVTSYLFPKVETLTKFQAVAACLWIIYGLAIHAVPVLVTNLIVAGPRCIPHFGAAADAVAENPGTWMKAA